MSTEQATQAPIIVEVAGEQVSFPRLVMADMMAWGAELKTARRLAVENRVKLDQSLSGFERQRLIQLADEQEVELGHLVLRAYTPVGIHKVLTTSLQKSMTDAKAILATVAKMHFTAQAKLAEKLVSSPDPVKEESPPLPLAAPATEETGALSEP